MSGVAKIIPEVTNGYRECLSDKRGNGRMVCVCVGSGSGGCEAVAGPAAGHSADSP